MRIKIIKKRLNHPITSLPLPIMGSNKEDNKEKIKKEINNIINLLFKFLNERISLTVFNLSSN